MFDVRLMFFNLNNCSDSQKVNLKQNKVLLVNKKQQIHLTEIFILTFFQDSFCS